MEEQKYVARFPAILYKRIQAEVKQRQEAGEPKLSINDWVIDACRGKIDGPPVNYVTTIYKEPPPGLVVPHQALQKPTAAEIAAKFGIKTGATIEVVEPRMDAESGFIPGSQVSADGQQPVPGASEDDTQIRNFKAEFGAEATKRMLQQRGQMRRNGIKTWGQVFEMAREQKERGE